MDIKQANLLGKLILTRELTYVRQWTALGAGDTGKYTWCRNTRAGEAW